MAVRKIVSNIAGLKVDEGSWGGIYSSHSAIRARNIKFTPAQMTMNPEYQKNEAVRGPDASIVGAYGGQLSFEIAMRGVAGVVSEFRKLLQYSGNFAKRPAGSGKVTGATVNTLVGLTVDIGAYEVGDAVMVTGSGTNTQVRFITRVQDDVPGAGSTTLTISPDWSDIPTNGDSLVAMDTWTPKVGEPSSYFEFLHYLGAGSTDRHLFTITDCALSNWKLKSTGPNALPFLELVFEADSWASSEDSSTISADPLNPAFPLLGDKLYVAGTALAVESIALDAGLKLVPFTSQEGVNGRGGWHYIGCDPKLEIRPYHDTTWITRLLGATSFEVMLESIKDMDEAWAIWAPACQVINIAPDAMGNGLLGDMPELLLIDPGKNADNVNIPLFAIACVGAGP